MPKSLGTKKRRTEKNSLINKKHDEKTILHFGKCMRMLHENIGCFSPSGQILFSSSDIFLFISCSEMIIHNTRIQLLWKILMTRDATKLVWSIVSHANPLKLRYDVKAKKKIPQIKIRRFFLRICLRFSEVWQVLNTKCLKAAAPPALNYLNCPAGTGRQLLIVIFSKAPNCHHGFYVPHPTSFCPYSCPSGARVSWLASLKASHLARQTKWRVRKTFQVITPQVPHV